jgi:hypothetical protein
MIQGLPTYHTLNVLCQQLYRNTNSISSALGGGGHGYIGALMSSLKYLAAMAPNNVTFTTPVFPGYLPVAIVGTATAMADQLCAHNKDLRKWREHDNVTKALHN